MTTLNERPQPGDGADPPHTRPGNPDERPPLPPNPQVTPLDDEEHVKEGIEVRET